MPLPSILPGSNARSNQYIEALAIGEDRVLYDSGGNLSIVTLSLSPGTWDVGFSACIESDGSCTSTSPTAFIHVGSVTSAIPAKNAATQVTGPDGTSKVTLAVYPFRVTVSETTTAILKGSLTINDGGPVWMQGKLFAYKV